MDKIYRVENIETKILEYLTGEILEEVVFKEASFLKRIAQYLTLSFELADKTVVIFSPCSLN
jgi:ATP/maltotriose-dependent transcriptional regulator MalT